MKIGPKYKIARRLGAPIFEKTQGQKYALSLARKEKNMKGRMKPKSEFGKQLIEKQKARFSYGISEKQFSKYTKEALNAAEPMQKLFRSLELRLDNILYRSGFAKTRASGRQMAAHGHATVNGRRVTIPSMKLSEGDVVGIRDGSKESPLFGEVVERMGALTVANWLILDPKKKESKVSSLPTYVPGEHVFDLGAVLEFYSR
ncbi:MAG: ribosomal protein S4 [Parcubacteria bacterium C7867-005]|nr:MAG: ribosomal protein S4 [Parcubacteria bacterium C7867-005]